MLIVKNLNSNRPDVDSGKHCEPDRDYQNREANLQILNILSGIYSLDILRKREVAKREKRRVQGVSNLSVSEDIMTHSHMLT